MSYFTSEKINPNVTGISCVGDVYAYLVEGEESAVLIDTGFGVGSLKEYVDSLTNLSYVVLLTHGHIDHASGAGEFSKVYLNHRDLQVAVEQTEMEKRMERFPELVPEEFIAPCDVNQYLPLEDGQNFYLGGLTVKALEMSGHTGGSMAILICEHRLVLLGDACNSFGYLQLPESSGVREYRDNLIAFRRYVKLFDEVLYSHPHNFGGKEIIEETIALCDEVLTEGFQGIPMEMPWFGGTFFLAKAVDEKSRRVDGGTANFIYREK